MMMIMMMSLVRCKKIMITVCALLIVYPVVPGPILLLAIHQLVLGTALCVFGLHHYLAIN